MSLGTLGGDTEVGISCLDAHVGLPSGKLMMSESNGCQSHCSEGIPRVPGKLLERGSWGIPLCRTISGTRQSILGLASLISPGLMLMHAIRPSMHQLLLRFSPLQRSTSADSLESSIMCTPPRRSVICDPLKSHLLGAKR